MTEQRHRPLSGLRARTALVVLLAFVPAFIVVYVAHVDSKNDARDDAGTEARALTDSVAAQYGSFVGDTETLLRAIGSIPGGDAILAQCPDALGAVVRQSPTYENLFIMGANGSLVCSARPLARAGRTTDDWLAEATRRGAFVGLVDGATTTGDPAFTVATAFDGDDGPYVVAAQTTLGGLAALVEAGTLDSEASVTLLDAQDTILYQRGIGDDEDGGGVAIGEPFGGGQVPSTLRDAATETIVATGPDGVRRIYGAADLREPDGSVVVAGIPTASAYEAPARSLRVRMVALVFATIIAIAIALAFAHLSVIRRIHELVAMTRRIGGGDLGARSHSTSRDEIGELGRSLDAMAEEIRARDIEREHLLGAIVEASEEERRRIAGDVHDDSIQIMSAHVMNLQLMRRRVDDDAVRQQIVDLEESGRAATARLRDLVFELYSPTLEEHGLVAALESLLARAFKDGYGDDVGVAHTLTSTLEDEPPLPTAAVAYRIAQEAIRNARMHASPATVHVTVRRDGADLVVEVHDDGTGFDTERVVERPGHLGLRGMRERAGALGGSVTVTSAIGAGTTVVGRVPWFTGESREDQARPSTS